MQREVDAGEDQNFQTRSWRACNLQIDCIVDAPDAQGTAGLKETLVSRCPAVPSRV